MDRRKFIQRSSLLVASSKLGLNRVYGDEAHVPTTYERMAELTIQSSKAYSDPFNDLEVSAVFEQQGQSWKVPAFWRGDARWTVRFAPSEPGDYVMRWESTDKSNADLNGSERHVRITEYKGENPLLKRGMIRVSTNRRYFEYSDGTPFYWLGDSWYTGLSDRLSWETFQRITADRKTKGFTVVELAVMTCSNEEQAPVDPGFSNEGGAVWDSEFKQINPKYFDYADRRIQHLIDNGMVPALIGAWRQALHQMGVSQMKKHWRQIIARWGAYPVLWITGGEVYDPPDSQRRPGLPYGASFIDLNSPGWTDVARYIRTCDPYHHPLTVHEIDPPFDSALRDEKLTDFDLFQAGHRGWASIATEIALLNKHYSRTTVRKPLVVGEIGWEKMTGAFYEDFQRAAFWLAMLNGAAGFSYGTISTAEAYSANKPLHRRLHSPYTAEEAMQFPGSTQVGLGADFLRRYPWWEMSPHPEWVSPRGTTLLEPNEQVSGFDIDLIGALAEQDLLSEDTLPAGEWSKAHGNWRLPYAAGIPGKVRFIYLPYNDTFLRKHPLPSVHGLEPGVQYHAYYWEPTLGTKFDMGVVGADNSGSPSRKVDITNLDRQLYDARGHYRGELRGSVWDSWGTNQLIEGDTYHPEKPPFGGDFLLVLDAMTSPPKKAG